MMRISGSMSGPNAISSFQPTMKIPIQAESSPISAVFRWVSSAVLAARCSSPSGRWPRLQDVSNCKLPISAAGTDSGNSGGSTPSMK